MNELYRFDLDMRPAALWTRRSLMVLNSVIAVGIKDGANAMDACPTCGQWHLCTGHKS